MAKKTNIEFEYAYAVCEKGIKDLNLTIDFPQKNGKLQLLIFANKKEAEANVKRNAKGVSLQETVRKVKISLA